MIILETIMATIASLGFGVIFNIRGNKLLFAALGGGICWFSYSLCLNLNFSVNSALFISSICFSAYSEIFARILKTPVTTLVVCALIPLVPGGGMYYTMLEVVHGNIDKSLQLGLNAIAAAGTLALGIIFVGTITKLIVRKKHSKKVISQ